MGAFITEMNRLLALKPYVDDKKKIFQKKVFKKKVIEIRKVIKRYGIAS